MANLTAERRQLVLNPGEITMSTKYGTAYFPTRGNAIRYYRAYEDDPAAAVDRKLAEGQIHIGKPPTKPGDILTIEDCRYYVTEGPRPTETMEDDHGFPATEIRVLPTGGSGNALVGRRGYEKEMAFRRERVRDGVPFDLPSWDSLRVYWRAGEGLK